MLKELILSILSFSLFTPASLNSAAQTYNEPEPIVEKSINNDPTDPTGTTGDPNVLHGYTYTDTQGNSEMLRVFDDRQMGPQVRKVFCAPAGYCFVIDINEQELDEIFDQAEFLGINYNYISIAYYYGIYGAEVTVDSENRFYDQGGTDAQARAWYKEQYLKFFEGEDKQGRLLLQVDNVTVPTDLYLRFEVMFTLKELDSGGYSQWWKVVTFSETVHVEPYKETDFVQYRLRYYQRGEGEKRLNIDAILFDDFFNQYGEYNKYGWATDDIAPCTTLDEETPIPSVGYHYYCNFDLTLVAYDTVVVGKFRTYSTTGDLEMMLFPPEPIEVKIKLSFTSGGKEYSYYSEKFLIGDPKVRIEVDSPENRQTVQKHSTHIYNIGYDNFTHTDIAGMNIMTALLIERLMDDGQRVKYLYNGVLPSSGEEGVYYYLPSAYEKALHDQGRDEELMDLPSQGTYYTWSEEWSVFSENNEYPLFNKSCPEYTEEEMLDPTYSREPTQEDIKKFLNQEVAIPVVGKFSGYHIFMNVYSTIEGSYISCEKYTDSPLEVVPANTTEDEILLNVSDNINLLAGADDIRIIPSISSYDESVTYYYDYSVSKEGIIDVIKDTNGRLTVAPVHAGVVQLTIGVECSEFSRITKTVNIRVLDAIYDVAKLELPDEFHYADQDLTVSISIRGFKDIQNVDIDWKVVNKDGEELPAEKMEVHHNASMTLLKPESDDYTVTASYEGIELGTIAFQVRRVNMDAFLKANIWWIVLITLGFVALVIIIQNLFRKGRTTVDSISRVYDVLCSALSDDKLTEAELKRIKREISRCLNRVENLNVDALNQYEKAIRYLRKSLSDVKSLLKKWDKISIEDKSVIIERLNADLSKALMVAKEIESAKQIIDEYHANANKKNFETLKEEKK